MKPATMKQAKARWPHSLSVCHVWARKSAAEQTQWGMNGGVPVCTIGKPASASFAFYTTDGEHCFAQQLDRAGGYLQQKRN